MIENCGIFSSTCSDSYLLSWFEEIVFHDCLVGLKLEALEEALLANGLLSFRALYHCFSGGTDFTKRF